MSIIVRVQIEKPEVGRLWNKGQLVSLRTLDPDFNEDGMQYVEGEIVGYSLTDEDAAIQKAEMEAETL